MHLENSGTYEDNLTAAQKVGLQTAWNLIRPNLQNHALNIFAKFYDTHRNYLDLFQDHHKLHEHTEKTLEVYTNLIDDGLYCLEHFNYTMSKVSQKHQSILNRSDIIKLNEIIKEYIFKYLEQHMTKTLREAFDIFLSNVESFFEDQVVVDDE